MKLLFDKTCSICLARRRSNPSRITRCNLSVNRLCLIVYTFSWSWIVVGPSKESTLTWNLFVKIPLDFQRFVQWHLELCIFSWYHLYSNLPLQHFFLPLLPSVCLLLLYFAFFVYKTMTKCLVTSSFSFLCKAVVCSDFCTPFAYESLWNSVIDMAHLHYPNEFLSKWVRIIVDSFGQYNFVNVLSIE